MSESSDIIPTPETDTQPPLEVEAPAQESPTGAVESVDSTNNTDSEQLAEPTVAIIADPYASTFLLRDTFSTLFATYGVRRAYVDLTTLAGLTAAGELVQAGIPYEHLDFGQAIPEEPALAEPEARERTTSRKFRPNRPRTIQDLPYLRNMSAGTHRIDLDQIPEVNTRGVQEGRNPLICGTAELRNFSPRSPRVSHRTLRHPISPSFLNLRVEKLVISSAVPQFLSNFRANAGIQGCGTFCGTRKYRKVPQRFRRARLRVHDT